jgi:hypothetical protein
MANKKRRGGDVSALFREIILAIAAAYGKPLGLSRSQVSKRCYGRGNFLDNLKAGKQSLSLVMVDRILDYFRDNWPDQAEWPYLRAIVITRDGNI